MKSEGKRNDYINQRSHFFLGCQPGVNMTDMTQTAVVLEQNTETSIFDIEVQFAVGESTTMNAILCTLKCASFPAYQSSQVWPFSAAAWVLFSSTLSGAGGSQNPQQEGIYHLENYPQLSHLRSCHWNLIDPFPPCAILWGKWLPPNLWHKGRWGRILLILRKVDEVNAENGRD